MRIDFRYLSIPLAATMAFAQVEPARIQPVREKPAEKLAVNAGFRDWGPATIAGTVILAGNQTNRGGLFAVDTATGKVKWSYRPVFPSGTAAVSTAPAVTGDLVIVPFAAANPGAVVAVSLATGKELWRGPDPMAGAAVAAQGPTAYVFGKNGYFHALDAATGRERWKVAFATNRAACASRPIVREDSVYFTAAGEAGYYLFALDARTGKEQWRYRAEAPNVHAGVCLSQPVVSGEGIFATGESRLYGVRRATGRDLWAPVEIRRPVEGRVRAVEVSAVVDAGAVVVGMTPGSLAAFEKRSGQTAWEIAGQYRLSSPAMTVADNVLYFQGQPGDKGAGSQGGTLHALDLNTQAFLWAFSRPAADPNWAFGYVTPADGTIWGDSYQVLVKLQ